MKNIRRKSTPNSKGERQKSEEKKTLSFHKVGTTSSGNILVEMTPGAWERLCGTGTQADIELGAAIRGFREKHRMSQSEFGKLVGHSRNWISELERDADVRLSYKSFRKILSVIRG